MSLACLWQRQRGTSQGRSQYPCLEYSAIEFLRKAEVGKLGASGWASKALAVRSKETLMVGPAAGNRRVDGDVVIESLWTELAPAPGRWQRAVFIGLATLTALVLSFSLQVPSFAAPVVAFFALQPTTLCTWRKLVLWLLLAA